MRQSSLQQPKQRNGDDFLWSSLVPHEKLCNKNKIFIVRRVSERRKKRNFFYDSPIYTWFHFNFFLSSHHLPPSLLRFLIYLTSPRQKGNNHIEVKEGWFPLHLETHDWFFFLLASCQCYCYLHIMTLNIFTSFAFKPHPSISI